MTVSFIRQELKNKLKIYSLIDDCIEGEYKIKEKKTDYLPDPDPEDEDSERYDNYLKRAVFYNVTSRTLKGLVGQIYLREPVIEVPEILNNVLDNCNGEGVNIIQLSKKAVNRVLSKGRCGLFIDFPVTENGVSKKDFDEGIANPTIELYEPQNIINWRTKKVGSKTILSLIVLEEIEYIQKGDFELTESTRYKVLRLGKSKENKIEGLSDNPDIYTVEIWEKSDSGLLISESYQPVDKKGNNLKEILFTFIGSENNDSCVDEPPLYPIASLNIHHYQNSADYEEICFLTGQPTPYATGITQQWLDDVLQGALTLGSRGGIPLESDSTVGLLQVTENTMSMEAMQHKERQMVALGAKLVEQKTVQRTATEAGLESASENSVLTNSAKNVSDAFRFAFEKALLFVGNDESEIKFELNTEFDISNMNSQDIQVLMQAYEKGNISFSEMREGLRNAGLARLDDDLAKKEIEEERIKNENNEIEFMKKQSSISNNEDEKQD